MGTWRSWWSRADFSRRRLIEAAGSALVNAVAFTLIGGVAWGVAMGIVAALVVLGLSLFGLVGAGRGLSTPVKAALLCLPFLAAILVAIAT